MTRVDRTSYETNGFLLVPQVLPRPEIDRLREEIDDLRDRVAGGTAAIDGTWKGDSWKEKLLAGERPRGLLLESLHNLQNQSAVVARLLFDARLLDVIVQLIGPAKA